jgi:thiol-disulfide isomerase/thioredoxin
LKLKLTGWLSVSCILFLLSFNTDTSASSAGIDLSTLTVVNLKGANSSVEDIKVKKNTYIKFWASWCQPCLEQMPHFQAVAEKYGEDIDIIAVNIDLNESNEAIEQVIKNFKLTMPVVKDSYAELKKAFQFVGTPFNVLLNENGQILHTGHEANEQLDRRLALLAKNQGGSIANIELSQADDSRFDLDSLSKGTKILFFTSTWCDWYLQESRPEMSAACIKAQENLSAQDSQGHITIVSHMWTGDDEIAQFKSKYDVKTPILLDTGGDAFFTFNVKSFPTYVVLQDGKEVYRTSNYNDKRLHGSH